MGLNSVTNQLLNQCYHSKAHTSKTTTDVNRRDMRKREGNKKKKILNLCPAEGEWKRESKEQKGFIQHHQNHSLTSFPPEFCLLPSLPSPSLTHLISFQLQLLSFSTLGFLSIYAYSFLLQPFPPTFLPLLHISRTSASFLLFHCPLVHLTIYISLSLLSIPLPSLSIQYQQQNHKHPNPSSPPSSLPDPTFPPPNLSVPLSSSTSPPVHPSPSPSLPHSRAGQPR